jgi:NADH-quinone oxidoreductase subunit J
VNGEAVVFWLLAPLSVLGAVGMLLSRKAVHCAIWLALTMICLAMLYIAQEAVFLGIVQVVVYTGAIMMLFLFVLMIVGVDASDSLVETIRGQRFASLLGALGFAFLLVAVVGRVTYAPVGLASANANGNVEGIAQLIFTRYVFAFELTSALLITAAVGAMVLAFRERLHAKVTQREMAEQRFRRGGIVTPLPAPGVYARHNAVDTPALLPDGSQSDLSVNAVLRGRGDERRLPSQLATTLHTDGEPAIPDEPDMIHSEPRGISHRESELS